jgi:hypothetical protein
MVTVAAVVGTAPAAATTAYFRTVLQLPGFQSGQDIAVDADGNTVVVAHSNTDTDNDVLISKVDPTGTELWSTTLGTTRLDTASAVAVDTDGNVFVAGRTMGSDFPLVEPLQSTLGGFQDAFVTKLSGENGAILASTLFGGGGSDAADDIVVAGDGTVIITGSTDSTDFPTMGALFDELNLTSCFCNDAFVSQLAFGPDGIELLFSTYLGGALDDTGSALGVAADGTIFLAGSTRSRDFPVTAGAAQTTFAGGSQDLFVAAITTQRSALGFASYHGGDRTDSIGDVVATSTGELVMVGSTQSEDFPTTPGTFQPDFVGAVNGCGSPPFDPLHNCSDAFASVFTASGELAHSTYLGGTMDDAASSVAVGFDGLLHLVGDSRSADFPLERTGTTPSAILFVSQLSPSVDDLAATFEVATQAPSSGHGIKPGDDGSLLVTGADSVPSDVLITAFGPCDLNADHERDSADLASRIGLASGNPTGTAHEHLGCLLDTLFDRCHTSH